MPLPVLRGRRHEGVASRLVVKKTEHATFAGPPKASTPLMHHGDRRTARRRAGFADFARDRFIIGDKVSVKEEIARYRELLGVDHFIMRCQWPGLPQERVLGSIQRLGEIFA